MNTGKNRQQLRVHLWKKIEVNEAGCWIWNGYTDSGGYGMTSGAVFKRERGFYMIRVHQAMYLLDVGEIPEGMQLHHVCEVRRCCNPEHLVPMSHREHQSFHRGETCKRNHDPLHWQIRPKGRGRICMECQREYDRRRYALRPR